MATAGDTVCKHFICSVVSILYGRKLKPLFVKTIDQQATAIHLKRRREMGCACKLVN